MILEDAPKGPMLPAIWPSPRPEVTIRRPRNRNPDHGLYCDDWARMVRIGAGRLFDSSSSITVP
jgi:hypothetical protein